MLGKENLKPWFAELNVDMDKVSLVQPVLERAVNHQVDLLI